MPTRTKPNPAASVANALSGIVETAEEVAVAAVESAGNIATETVNAVGGVASAVIDGVTDTATAALPIDRDENQPTDSDENQPAPVTGPPVFEFAIVDANYGRVCGMTGEPIKGRPKRFAIAMRDGRPTFMLPVHKDYKG